MNDLPKQPLPQTANVNVPAFSCRIYISQDEQSIYRAREATIDSIVGSGISERDALQDIATKLKTFFSEHVSVGKEIPRMPETEPQSDEVIRVMAIHL